MFVLPRFMVLFAGKEALLPTATKVLLGLSGFLVNYWYVPLAAALVATWGIMMILQTTRGRTYFDQLKLVTPLLGRMFRALYISRRIAHDGPACQRGGADPGHDPDHG